jgi:hypothetical protein
MKVLFAIYCGLTQMTDAVGVYLLVVLAIHSGKIFLNNSTTQITWFVLPVLISLS